MEYEKEGSYPCHMPGHKGHGKGSFLGDILRYDITEIDGMDNLHDPGGVIYESERSAGDLYGSNETHFLVNGSTCGILSAITGTLREGDKILIGRNCHKSVYNAVCEERLECSYLYPGYIEDFGINSEVTCRDLKKALDRDPKIKAVVITSPTYEGIVSDIEGLARICHERGVILITDSAHGAHFGFHEGFPEGHVRQGADVVIHSVHKTLPGPTQTALIHINGDLADREGIRNKLKVFQSSSPSYLLMAGIDDCMDRIHKDGDRLFCGYLEKKEAFMDKAGSLKRIRVTDSEHLKDKYGVFDADPCKFMISDSLGMITGKEIYDELRAGYGIRAEMASLGYCLLIMTVLDEREGFDRVINAIKCIDEKYSRGNEPSEDKNKDKIRDLNLYDLKLKQVMPPHKAVSSSGREVSLLEAVGHISGGYISLYPPGIPLIVPGEEITEELTEGILSSINKGLNVQGLSGDRMIRVYE
ncbi:MAG: aminotransferase class I/II-fold pyridoxal phosphate-dependent enzyme [Lachnospiraceae bacterium]|nr:aminotransferase class I/II-fold pyridoxal phosphate-dependent enzyme [Lachnospiraceae bacterium]